MPLCGKAGIDITSPGVCVEGVDGAELGDGPAVFAVPELLAGPEDAGCFLFLPGWFFEALKCVKDRVRNIKAVCSGCLSILICTPTKFSI